jgi:hypothetical protein
MTNPFVLLLILLVFWNVDSAYREEIKRVRAETLVECQSEED